MNLPRGILWEYTFSTIFIGVPLNSNDSTISLASFANSFNLQSTPMLLKYC